MKTDVNRLILVSKLKKVRFWQNISETLFSLSKPNVGYLHTFLPSLPFPKFRKQNFLYSGDKLDQIFHMKLLCISQVSHLI